MWETDGFVKGTTDIVATMQQLENHIETFPAKLKQYTPAELLKKPAPDKWSRQEIVGHLIDSAINNLKRFTEIQFLPQPFKVISYQQTNLVAVNDYQHLPIDHLLNLWQSLNRQIVFVVNRIPAEKLLYPVDPQYQNQEMKNLNWIICDYVVHMEHHFKQVFGE